jgi:hypothetical protein
MSAYAQMMKKKGSIIKKPRKETLGQNLECELLTDHGVPSPGAPQPQLLLMFPNLLSLKLPGKRGLCCAITCPHQPLHLKTRGHSISGIEMKSPSSMMMTEKPLFVL